MNLWPFARKPEPAPVRYIVATKRESHEAQRAKLFKELELGIAVSRLSPDQKREAISRASISSVVERKG